MTFPKTWEEYEKIYGFTDEKEYYTNKSRLIQSFRVKQWLEHIEKRELEEQRLTEKHWGIQQKCHTCKHYTKGEYDGSCGSYICKEYSGWEDKTE